MTGTGDATPEEASAPGSASEAGLSWRAGGMTVWDWIVALGIMLPLAELLWGTRIPTFLLIGVLLTGGAVLAWRQVVNWAAATYQLFPRGILVKQAGVTSSYTWDEFRGFGVDGRELHLLFRPPPLRDPVRLLTRRNLDEVLAYIQAHVPAQRPEAQPDDR